jgi:pimeloyl-ACP methyl ester carboxylesterase
METKVISTDVFVNLQYRKTGSGPAIVLLHGFPVSGLLWSRVWDKIGEHNTVIVPDLPGTGGSAGVANLSMELMADGVKAILDAEGITNAVIAGHSMGGYVCMAFADRYPEMVWGIAMVHSIASDDTEEKKETRRKSIALIEKGGKEPFVKQMIPNLFSPKSSQLHPEWIEEQIDEALKVPAESLSAFYNAMINRRNHTETLSKATFPLFWIAGKDDGVIPADKVIQQSMLASVNFVEVYDDCGHMGMIEQSERLADDINRFSKYCSNANA